MTLNDAQFGPGGFKGNAGKGPQQGTLFSGPKPTDDHRWPQGFTPDRKAEVERSVRVGKPAEQSSGWFSGHAGAARIKGTIARSTAPLDDLRRHPGTPPEDTTDVPRTSVKATGALPRQVWGQHVLGGVTISSSETDRHNIEHALMHELGHADSTAKQLPHSGISRGAYTGIRSPQHLGQEEAYADDFANTHYRADKRDNPTGRPHESAYEDRRNWQDYVKSMGRGVREPSMQTRSAGQQAHKAYNDARTTTNGMEARRSSETKAVAAMNNLFQGPQQRTLWNDSDRQTGGPSNPASLGQQFGEVPYEHSLPKDKPK